MKKVISVILLTGLFTTVAMAQPSIPEGSFFQRLRSQFFGERQAERQELRQEIRDERDDLRSDIEEKRDQMLATTTPLSSTTRKEFRQDAMEMGRNFASTTKAEIKDFRDGKKEDMNRFIGTGFLKNATATAMLAQKLGTTTEALQQMAASGTLQSFMKTKLGTDDVKRVIPKNILGTSTTLFATNSPVTISITQGTTTVSTTTIGGLWGFFRSIFGR